MNRNRVCIISAMIVALILLYADIFPASLPMTETIYTIPEGEVEITLRGEVFQVSGWYRVEDISLGFGVLTDLSVWLTFRYMHDGIVKSEEGRPGDGHIRIWYYLGDYWKDRVHLGLSTGIRLPTGPNAMQQEKWRNLSLGRSEIRLGPVVKLDLPASICLHGNLFYSFRQDDDEDFYGGFHLHPFKLDTYRKVFGLNPAAEDAFLSAGRFKNDYCSLALAVNTGMFYPMIPYIGFYGSLRLYRGTIAASDIPIEGGGVDPVLFYGGLRYFFTPDTLLGLYVLGNPCMNEGYIHWIFGLDFSMAF